jgi:hypothetical protein
VREISDTAREVARMRDALAEDRLNPLYTRHPEAWLEAQKSVGIEIRGIRGTGYMLTGHGEIQS